VGPARRLPYRSTQALVSKGERRRAAASIACCVRETQGEEELVCIPVLALGQQRCLGLQATGSRGSSWLVEKENGPSEGLGFNACAWAFEHVHTYTSSYAYIYGTRACM
jgi:hypothetical protein